MSRLLEVVVGTDPPGGQQLATAVAACEINLTVLVSARYSVADDFHVPVFDLRRRWG